MNLCDMKTTERYLELEKAGQRMAIPFEGQARNGLTLNVDEDYAIDAMLLSLHTRIVTEKVEDYPVSVTASVQVPQNPWQHFKEWYAPVWFLDRYPVRYLRRSNTKSGCIRVAATYPNFQPIQKPCVFQMFDKTEIHERVEG